MEALSFSVVDTGCGIVPDNQQRIFEAFEQENNNTAKYYGGTGLGLSIAKRFTKLMGGILSLQSELGKGSRFAVELPFGTVEQQDTENFHFSPWRILVAVVDTVNLNHLVSLLQSIGIAADGAQTRSDAMELLQTNSYTICITEQSVLEQGLQNESIPVLLRRLNTISASSFARRSGVTVLLPAPVFRSELVAILNSLKKSQYGFSSANKCDFCFAGRRVLIVEDNELNREIAVELIAATVPIFAMSANAFSEDVELSISSGMNRHLSKPINIEDVYSQMESLFSGKG